MSVFVHLTSIRNVASIRRAGIGRRARWSREVGVHAMPVTLNFSVSHQWLRELKRWRAGTIVGVYFRLPDEQPVTVGHYGGRHVEVTAAEAVALMMGAERLDPSRARRHDADSRGVRRGERSPSSPEGYEVIVPRRIERPEILRVRALPQVVGWRYFPGSHGKPPCTCDCCARGASDAGRLRRAVEDAEAGGRPTKATVMGRSDASSRRVERLRRLRGIA